MGLLCLGFEVKVRNIAVTDSWKLLYKEVIWTVKEYMEKEKG